jgi:CRP-like cAMP-binding protein
MGAHRGEGVRLQELPQHVSSEARSLERRILQETDIFKSLSEDQRDKVASLVQRLEVTAGQALGTSGEVGECLFIVISSEARRYCQ